jgi:magnesium chelatase accessory protein
MSRRQAWLRDGKDWPHHEASRFVQAGGISWHVQISGTGPVVVLVHGTAASTHSWRDLVPSLTPHFTVVAIDLPGHGFSESPPSHLLSLPVMARGVHRLLSSLELSPALVVGHSAGAAILARMTIDKRISPRGLVSFNGAFLPFDGVAGTIFSPLARFLVRLPLLPQLVAWRAADRGMVEQLIRGTGSTLDRTGLDFYARLIRDPDHAAAALGMMAHWDLAPLVRDLPRLMTPLLLVTGANDRSIRPSDAPRVRRLVPGAIVESLPKLGHLAHEERPDLAAALVLRLARETGVLAA